MKALTILTFFLTALLYSFAQMYFPPNNSDEWETILPSELNWCESKIDSLNIFLEDNNTKAFILLKDGKIVIEEYFNDHSASTNWYWASAGKTLTAYLVGIAQQENLLSISDETSDYLGEGWTSATNEQESEITIWHQLTMTSGLDDQVNNLDCTDPNCLEFLAEAGTRWSYHNAPYTLLTKVIEEASGLTLNAYTNQKVKNPTGMDGLYVNQGFNAVYISTARSMARFGLLTLNNGNWNGNSVLNDQNYFQQMTTTSQSLNKSYGYLWWLNGKDSFLVPQSQFEFQGSLMPNGPNDLITALGLNGQFINVVPSQGLVWIRMGEAPGNDLVPFMLNDAIWEYINDFECNPLNTMNNKSVDFTVFPNPFNDELTIKLNGDYKNYSYSLVNTLGETVSTGELTEKLNFRHLDSGIYYLTILHKKDGGFEKVKSVKVLRR